MAYGWPQNRYDAVLQADIIPAWSFYQLRSDRERREKKRYVNEHFHYALCNDNIKSVRVSLYFKYSHEL